MRITHRKDPTIKLHTVYGDKSCSVCLHLTVERINTSKALMYCREICERKQKKLMGGLRIIIVIKSVILCRIRTLLHIFIRIKNLKLNYIANSIYIKSIDRPKTYSQPDTTDALILPYPESIYLLP